MSIGQVVSLEAIGLIRKVPAEAVMRMALVGRYERMSAARAFELGMVSEVVDPPDRLRDAAQELAEKVARNSPAALAATKRALWGALEAGLTDACRAGARDLVSVWGHPDQTEGPAAFAGAPRAVVAAAGPRPAWRGPVAGRSTGGLATASPPATRALRDRRPRGGHPRRPAVPPPGEPAGDDEAVLVHVDDTAWARRWARTRAQSVADALAAAGVAAGDRVGVMLPNGVDVSPRCSGPGGRGRPTCRSTPG